jgi:hypothetical protein
MGVIRRETELEEIWRVVGNRIRLGERGQIQLCYMTLWDALNKIAYERLRGERGVYEWHIGGVFTTLPQDFENKPHVYRYMCMIP